MRLLNRKPLLIGSSVLLATLAALGVGLSRRDVAVTVPAGTRIQVRLAQSISSQRAASGEPFQATVAEAVVIDGKTVIPQNAPVQGRIRYAHESGRLHGVARVSLDLESVEIAGKDYDLHTGVLARHGGNHKKRNWALIGGGGGGGALIGALAAGGKGALIGGPVGAGAGVAVAALTGKKNFVLPAETVLTFHLVDPLNVSVKS